VPSSISLVASPRTGPGGRIGGMSRSAARVGCALLFMAFALAGCNKGPAEEALVTAETTLEGSRSALEGYGATDLDALDAAMAGARAAVEEGRYTDALRVAQDVPSRVEAAVKAAEAKRDALAATWADVSRPLPDFLERLRLRIERLAAKTATHPEATWVAAARRDREDLARAWARARAAHEGGDLYRALETAREVESGVIELAGRLGLELTSAPAPPRPAPPGGTRDTSERAATDRPVYAGAQAVEE